MPSPIGDALPQRTDTALSLVNTFTNGRDVKGDSRKKLQTVRDLTTGLSGYVGRWT